MQNQSNSLITFDTQLKTALTEKSFKKETASTSCRRSPKDTDDIKKEEIRNASSKHNNPQIMYSIQYPTQDPNGPFEFRYFQK